tara:strand:+ start:6582 stop:7220 length:639 start_codon:yes stop_codon:yes gene_type:complete
MDWRSILKFDENLYNHTDESTKEKHQRILDFIKNRPKTKGTGLRIKEFLDSGELDESFTALDLPRNSITPKTKEYYGPRSELVKDRVNVLIDTFSGMFGVYKTEIERESGMRLRDFTLAFSKLVKNFYYAELPDVNNGYYVTRLRDDEEINYKNQDYKETVENYINTFSDDNDKTNLLMHTVYRALSNLLPNRTESMTLSMNIRQDLRSLRE